MSLDKFDATMARADRVMARVDERQGASGNARLRERNRKMGGYGRALTRATIAALVIMIGAMAIGLLNPIGIIGFVLAVGIALVAFGLILFGGAAATATAPKIPTDASNGEMVDKFDSYMFRARRSLPAPAQAEIDRIGNALPPLRESLARLGDTVPEAQDARRLLSIHLPGLIDRYLHVPSAYRTEADGEGKTVDQRLVEALAAGREALGDIAQSLARGDVAAFETQGRFIEAKYKEKSLD